FSIVLLAILFAYDVKWFLLPDVITFPLIGIVALMAGLRGVGAENVFSYGVDVLFSVLILSGLYFLLWFMSRGQWVGFGDVKLGLALALLVADWRLALLTLFLANLIGTFIVLPGLIRGKIGRKAHVPFGPLLIA
ncbi:prepilin peptidase, partial [Pseudomonas aeruginosa]|uniref:prepilin peptidase n=1 Tax=Pseudomonas aeruginosa TaxID=287 RepID=UPI002F90739E